MQAPDLVPSKRFTKHKRLAWCSESLQGELERKTGEMQSTKTMLETTSKALREERQAHADTKRRLDEAQAQITRLNRQHQIGRASGGKGCVLTCKARWSPYN